MTIADAFARIEGWMRSNGARGIAKNLAAGASEKKLADLEKKLGFSLSADLRALWSAHDGQRKEGSDFYPFPLGPLWSVAEAADRSHVARSLEWMREEDRASVKESKITRAELASDAWVRFGGMDSDGLITNTESGRVFTIAKDSPPLHLFADSIEAWLTTFAAELEAGDFRIEDGELERRNREAEREEAEALAREKATAARKKATTPDALLSEAINKADDDLAREALTKAKQKGPAVYTASFELLFASAQPAFIASTLRPLLNAIKLTSEQWTIVAKGGEAIENAAIVSVARRRASEKL